MDRRESKQMECQAAQIPCRTVNTGQVVSPKMIDVSHCHILIMVSAVLAFIPFTHGNLWWAHVYPRPGLSQGESCVRNGDGPMYIPGLGCLRENPVWGTGHLWWPLAPSCWWPARSRWNTGKSVLFFGHLILCISWVGQSTNFRYQQNIYSL